ncbi:polysaccharide lyase family 8 super-sandwich domain-containing protein [Paraflavitalea sp. CAU 1676]|uniref:polysaccharide lyase family 8 super-sandwich domain-containing protein n=1 Tax=Paraflavitalea sp. CAU 1676 TaxID=3032598 RepID=UPI0023DA334F|nr:polysaccharide lyase family 8 super-sandwich domain-containing protein [Paraflavitalea sp. CAU 1676]MDF2188191.1 polysaccharide lyase family 8 super-sandwich domain-containing protein [Paraflavitalea sp. CAU 1676]
MLNKRIARYAAAFTLLAAAHSTYAQNTSLIKQRVVDDLLAPPVNQTAIQSIVQTIRPDGTWPGIDYKDVSRTGFQHKQHLDNMLELARAYKKPGSPLYHDANVMRAFGPALDHWIEKDYRCENWWWNEMGTPNLMVNILLVMDSDLTAQQRTGGTAIAHRANMETFGARPGGDLMPIAGMFAKQGLFLNNADTLNKALTAMASDMHTSTGRGMKPDKSFHHRTDNVISTLTYGTNYASSFAYWAARIKGAGFSFPDSSLRLVTDYFLDGICQSLVYSTWPDPGAMNRDISRRNALAPEDVDLAENLLAASGYRAAELKKVIAIREGKMKPDITSDRYFYYSHYYTHQRPNYFASVRMHSSRANNMEEPHNEEGVKNHFYGDGALFITRSTNEYNNIFPVWDWRKVPGTTTIQRSSFPHFKQLAKKGLTEFAGGATDGRNGVAAFDFASVHEPLKAHKAWFLFDKEVVCLGAGIHTDSALDVATTLNQSYLNGSVTVAAGSKITTLTNGAHNLPTVNWVWHDSIAYIFPQPAAVQLRNAEATGSWRQINHQAWATDEPVTKKTFTLWLDHGTQPQQASYAWIAVPAIAAKDVEAYRKQQAIEIISNTPSLQAVRHKTLQQTGIVFYTPGQIKLTEQITLTADQPCILLVSMRAGQVMQIAASDPTQKLGTLRLSLQQQRKASPGGGAENHDKTIQEKTIDIALPTPPYAGATATWKP